VGNWHADQIAKRAAQDREHVDMIVAGHNHPPWHNMHWPYHATDNQTVDSNDTNMDSEDLAPFESVNDPLKKHLLQVHRLGTANQDTIYYQALQRTAPQILAHISHKFLKDKNVTAGERKHTLQYRYGGLYTNRLAYRYGHTPSPNCTLCGQPDGGHHSVSGCPAINTLVIERHNSAARYIMKAICDGQLGANVIMTDIGNAEKMREAGFSTRPPARIPATVLPDIDSETRNSLRPDGLIVTNLDNPTVERKAYIIEVKYAADTDTQRQERNATEQHNRLQEELCKAGYAPQNIMQANIILGVGGTVFTDTLTTLCTLGVLQRDAEKTLTKVHQSSVKWLHKIFTYKLMKSKRDLPRQGVG
jgi:hypothetical protein